jgi:hypothetical protein
MIPTCFNTGNKKTTCLGQGTTYRRGNTSKIEEKKRKSQNIEENRRLAEKIDENRRIGLK